MRIAIGSDHRGVEAKSDLTQWLADNGHQVDDLGAHDTDSVDYPDIAGEVARRVAGDRAERGILLCGTGIGMAIAANKVPGVRAATVRSQQEAEISRQHNDLNVICLSGDSPVTELKDVIKAWLAAEFEGGRHARRVDKIRGLEDDC